MNTNIKTLLQKIVNTPTNSSTLDRLKSGFTIVELLIVIVVIGILAAISIVAYNGIQARAQASTIRSDLNGAIKKLEEYKVLNDKYPTTHAEFKAANIKFTSTPYRYLGYCVVENSANSDWAILVKPESNDGDYYIKRTGGIKMGALSWADDPATVCSRVGIPTPTTRAWIRSSNGWSSWSEH